MKEQAKIRFPYVFSRTTRMYPGDSELREWYRREWDKLLERQRRELLS